MTKDKKASGKEVASLCSRKRELTRSGPLPLVAGTEKMKKKKGGRPREAIRTRVRDGRVSFAVCENERAAIQIKYKLSLKCAADYCREALLRCDIHKARYNSFLKDIDTLTHSEFCRMVVMSSDVVSALSPEERHIIINLHKLGQRLNQLFVQGKLGSNINALAQYNAFMADFAEIKSYFQKKVKQL